MNFFVIVVALLLDQMFRPFGQPRAQRWYEEILRDWAGRACEAGDYAEVAAPLLPCLLLAFAAGALGWGLASANVVLGFLYAVVVLVVCLGSHNLFTRVSAYLKARAADDREGANALAALILEGEVPADPEARAQAIAAAVLQRSADWLFSVIFWFALLGPLGAVLFRAADIVAARAAADRPLTLYARSALRLKLVMGWVPQHLLSFTFAIAGGLDKGIPQFARHYREGATDVLDRGNLVLAAASAAALGGVAGAEADEVQVLHAAVDLVWRGIVIWLAVIGLIELLVWIF